MFFFFLRWDVVFFREWECFNVRDLFIIFFGLLFLDVFWGEVFNIEYDLVIFSFFFELIIITLFLDVFCEVVIDWLWFWKEICFVFLGELLDLIFRILGEFFLEDWCRIFRGEFFSEYRRIFRGELFDEIWLKGEEFFWDFGEFFELRDFFRVNFGDLLIDREDFVFMLDSYIDDLLLVFVFEIFLCLGGFFIVIDLLIFLFFILIFFEIWNL